MAFIQNQNVTQILPNPIQGKVEGFSLDQSNGEVLVLVSYADEEGNVQTRYFKQSELV